MPVMPQEHTATTTVQPATVTSNENISLHTVTRQSVPLNPPTSYRNAVSQRAPPSSSTQPPQSHSQTSSTQHQTSSRTSNRRRSAEEPSHVMRKKIKYEHRQGQIAFISDSLFKFMVEDDVCENFILQQNLESNISLHRGSKSAELFEKSSTSLTAYLESGVNKVILCCGTNDIANLPFTSHNVQEIAQHVTDVVSKFNAVCNAKNATLLYVTPSPNSYVSDTGFREFSEALNSHLTANQINYIQPFEILKTSPDKSYEAVIRESTSDQLHWTFEAGRQILKASLSHFGVGCSLTSTSHQSPLYTALQKHQINLCFKCGSPNHSKRDCRKSNLHCQHCGSRSHVEPVCGYKYLPCTHCGTVGHYVGNRKRCPLWRSRHHSSEPDMTSVRL